MKQASSNRPTGQMSVVSKLSGRSRDELYRLFRLEEAPRPVAHVSGVPVYDLDQCMVWLHPEGPVESGAVHPSEMLDLTP